MTEEDYILATNVARVGLALEAVRNTLPSVGWSERRLKVVTRHLARAQIALYEEINKEKEDDS